ncbi:DUF2567 domain-containing protein [Actinopolyspora saharensis]|uniref:DUF2567 domain-containing protein n=1 Tax=Actinopolyspora saharensis TaxID=995062 RepID=A0A1H1ARP2_9ACTN|nr:DUF2567 domain-containing protein [Actinopolyspora saharensis]SDQ42151.1 Protein of unknown function [Actinopolyspora saharensis]
MSEGPEDEPVSAAGTTAETVEGEPRRKPGVVVKADLLPALSVLCLVGLLGFPLGWIWARLAPPQESTLSADGELVPVLVESYHEFDGLAIFLLVSLSAGVLTAAALWLLRGRRGPVLLIAAVAGSVLAGWLGTRMGTSIVAGMYPMPQQVSPGDVVEVAPGIDTPAAWLTQPLAVAFVYGLLASWNGLDGLGRHRD